MLYFPDRGLFDRLHRIGKQELPDGPEPDLITSFQSDSAGNFTIGFPGREAEFSLIDPERGLYRETIKGKFRSYMIPASNVRKFDIIRYADTDGGMISWFERVEEE